MENLCQAPFRVCKNGTASGTIIRVGSFSVELKQ